MWCDGGPAYKDHWPRFVAAVEKRLEDGHKRPFSDVELAAHAERTLWENKITFEARRCGVEYRGLGAGEIVAAMADRIIHLEGKWR